jgi:hypothetical protein
VIAPIGRRLKEVDVLGSHAELSGPGLGSSSLRTTLERNMKRIVKLAQASGRDVAKSGYQEGLQSMWEARWTLLGSGGQAEWFQRHGMTPPLLSPLLAPPAPMHGVRTMLTGGREMPLSRVMRRIRRAL